MMRFYLKIKLLGRQLEFPSASSSPSSDSQADTINPGAAMDDEESPPLPPSASEKETKQPTDYLALGAGVLRVWQLSSSCFVYASTVSLYVYMRHVSLISDSSTLRHVRELGLVSCAYGTIVIFSLYIFRRWPRMPGWVVFAWSTFPGDLMMTGLAITMITLLSQAGLPHDCRGLVSNGLRLASIQSASVNQMPQTQTAPSPSFGNQLSMDSLCHVPRTAYAFCVIAIFSYTLSVLLTVFQLQRHHKKLDTPPPPRSYPGYIEVVVPAHVTRREPAPIPFSRAAPPARPHPPSILRNPPPPRAAPFAVAPSHAPSQAPDPYYSASSSSPYASPYAPTSSSHYASTSASYGSPSTSYASSSTSPSTVSSSLASASSSYTPHARALPPSTLPVQDDPNKYANMPPMEIVTVNPRLSMETTSTDPEIYLVTDGFRPEDPPEYSSRPSSLYNGESGP